MIQTRPAAVVDHPAYVRLFGELGIPDPLPGPESFRDRLIARMFVACDHDQVVGYISWRPYGALAHVVQVVVDPAWRGRRVGQTLLEHVRGVARDEGCTRWYLNVKHDNTPALRLYQRCGFVPEHRSWALSIPWAAARALPREPEVIASAVEPADDPAVAARFHLAVERIELFRSRSATRLVLLHAPETREPLGFAAFDPGFPGAPVFATMRVTLAGALFAALDPHAQHERFDYLRITIERDRPLYEAISAAGASLTFEVVQLESPL